MNNIITLLNIADTFYILSLSIHTEKNNYGM